MASDLTRERLRELLDYDPASGIFIWRQRKSRAVAGSIPGNGYVRIKVDGKEYKAHRLAFLWMTGEWPSDQVDHVNRVRSDNRWVNVR